MCLTVSPSETAKMKKTPFTQEVFWKILTKKGEHLHSPVQFGVLWAAGWKKARGKRSPTSAFIDGGAIFVFKTKKAAMASPLYDAHTDVVVKVLCDSEDFIACNGSVACFTKVYLTEEERANALETKLKEWGKDE